MPVSEMRLVLWEESRLGRKTKNFCFDTFRLMAQQLVERAGMCARVLLPFAKGKVSSFSAGALLGVETIMLTLVNFNFMILGDKGVSHVSWSKY